MTQETLLVGVSGGLAFAFAMIALLSYSYGHARGRLAEQDDLKWKIRQVERYLDDARDVMEEAE